METDMSWEKEFDACVPNPLADRPPHYVELGIAKAITSKAISTERQSVLSEVRELVGTLGTYRTARNIETLSKHDLLSALKEMEGEK